MWLKLLLVCALGLAGCAGGALDIHYGCPYSISSQHDTIGDAPSACTLGDFWDPNGIDPALEKLLFDESKIP